jgi:integrase
MRAIHRDHRPRLEAAIRNGKPLPEISPHDLRHTAGTQMLSRGMPVEVVSKILGHARVSITLDVYRHVLESEKKAVMVDLYPDPVPVRIASSATVN